MRIQLVNIAAGVALFHIIFVGLFLCTPMFCSEPGRVFSLHIPTTTIKQMEKLNVSPLMVSHTIQNGSRIPSTQGYKSLYVCNKKKLGVVVNELTGVVSNIIPNMCAYDFQIQRDLAEKKRKIRTL